jgi:hypothetical protein
MLRFKFAEESPQYCDPCCFPEPHCLLCGRAKQPRATWSSLRTDLGRDQPEPTVVAVKPPPSPSVSVLSPFVPGLLRRKHIFRLRLVYLVYSFPIPSAGGLLPGWPFCFWVDLKDPTFFDRIPLHIPPTSFHLIDFRSRKGLTLRGSLLFFSVPPNCPFPSLRLLPR